MAQERIDDEQRQRFNIPNLDGNEIAGQESQEVVGSYRSLQQALTPYIGPEIASLMGNVSISEGESYRTRITSYVSPARDRLPSQDEVMLAILGEQSTIGGTTKKVVRPEKSIVGIKVGDSSDDPELRSLQRLSWSGSQMLDRHIIETDDGGQQIVYLGNPEIELHGIPLHRIEMYEKFGDPANPNFRVRYFPYRADEGSRTTDGAVDYGSELEITDQGDVRITKILKQRGKEIEVEYCSLTNKSTGATVVFTDMCPEFIFMEPRKGGVRVNSVDLPVLYLPHDWPTAQKDIQALGETFAGIDMYYEAFENGIDAFLKYYNFDKSIGAKVTTSNLGSSALAVLGIGGSAVAMTADDIKRYWGGILAVASISALTYGIQRYGGAYRDLIAEVHNRGLDFTDYLASKEIFLPQ